MSDIFKIFRLEEEAEKLLQKIGRIQKHNERGRIGREGMFDQIENSIRICHNRREAILKEMEELKRENKIRR